MIKMKSIAINKAEHVSGYKVKITFNDSIKEK